ncbi:MAG TPA: hypothetical protein VIL18_05690 [Longimicrobiales bacterium]
MDDFGSLLFLVFVLWSVLRGVLGGGTQAPPRRGAPPRTRPRPEDVPPHGAPAGSRHETGQSGVAPPVETEAAASTSAADMIPDELWEILTGEKRRPVVVRAPEAGEETSPVRAHVPDLEPDFEPGFKPDYDEGDIESEFEPDEVAGLEAEPAPVPVGEDRSVEVLQPAGGAASLETEPAVVSLEAPLPPAAERHAAFHARITKAPAQRERAASRIPLQLGGRSELRRALILSEVLGPPKALE